MKKIFFYALLIPAFVGMMSSCGESKTDVKGLEGKWNIAEVKGEKVVVEEGAPVMEFNMTENKLHGNAGCNIFNTSVVVDPNDISAITINQAATTMMACPNMELEDKVLKSMAEVKAVKAGKSADEMLLVDAEGNVLFVLAR